MSINKVSVIGLGYIGLPTAAMFASRGIDVVGVDVNQYAVDTVNAGEIHIVEPGLREMVKSAVEAGNLRATTAPESADVFLIAVPTPFTKCKEEMEAPKPDLSYIESASRALAKVLKKGDLVILESTSPVGATEQMAAWLSEERPDLSFPQAQGEHSDIRIAHCPERVLPGQVIRELVGNDRIIGGMTRKCSEAATNLYRTFVKGDCVMTNARTAEMAKLTENASRDVGIAFANELSIICDSLNIDVWELIQLANRHPRVDILQPGPGVGGHCIAVDPWFIISGSPDQSQLIHTARKVNDYKPQWVVQKIYAAVLQFLSNNPDKTINEVSVSLFGLAFKANIDDLRESPALSIAKELVSFNFGRLLAVEPNVADLPAELKSDLELIPIEKALKLSDICVVLVDHDEFKLISKSALEGVLVVDTKGIWRSDKR